MTNNDILRSIRYILNSSETKIIEIIGLTGFKVSKEDLSSFLKLEDEPGYKNCGDKVLAHFLDGLIIFKRGLEIKLVQNLDMQVPNTQNTPGVSDVPSGPSVVMTNNLILKKLRVAFELKDTDIIRLIEKSGLKISKSELSAFFRNQDHRNYRDCGNQFLRNLLRGMAL